MTLDLLSLLILITAVNGLPFVAHLFLHERFGWPVDCGLHGHDGKRLLGDHKTVRGVVVAILGGGLLAPVFGLPGWLGAGVGAVAMVGDLLSSFLKRRWGDAEGRPHPLIDQFFEALFPAVLAVGSGVVTWQDGLGAAVAFVPLGYAGALFVHYILYRPSIANYPRLIRSSTRFREWRAAHRPMARWERWLNFENWFFYRVVIEWVFRALGLYERGVENVLAVRLRPYTFELPDLPAAFDGWRILLFTDLHIDGLPGLTEALIRQVAHEEVDLCLFGGDVRMELYGSMAPAMREMHRLIAVIRARQGVYGVLGNHDCIEMLPELEEAGITMLVNDAVEIRRDGASLWLVGIDDPHYYRCHDLDRAFRDVPAGAFSIFLSHTPEVYDEAADHGAGLYLCGHTHGGQICIPHFGPVFTHCHAPRRFAAGAWEHRGMPGYTSTGAGASGVPVRFFCPGEVPLITLRRGEHSDRLEHGLSANERE